MVLMENLSIIDGPSNVNFDKLLCNETLKNTFNCPANDVIKKS